MDVVREGKVIDISTLSPVLLRYKDRVCVSNNQRIKMMILEDDPG